MKSKLTVSICICTRNRPHELRNCLNSLAGSDFPIKEIVVSDDSTDDLTSNMISTEFSDVCYVKGPQLGLSANRNMALSKVTGDYISFLDDDVLLGSSFLCNSISCLSYYENPDRVIVTGVENNNGELVYPHEQSFLGFQYLNYKDNADLKTIVINSTIFPSGLFDTMSFDESLIYGYEEVDIATRAESKGYSIALCSAAINFHYPSKINRDYYLPFTNASRIYVTFKRYALTEKNALKAGIYLPVVAAHTLASAIKNRRVSGIIDTFRTFKTSFQYIRKLFTTKSEHNLQNQCDQ